VGTASNRVRFRRLLARPVRKGRAADFRPSQVYPDALTKEEVAVKAGYEANGGGFNNALGRLRTLELVQGHGAIKASDNLFDAG
jgi:uncharacterized protein